MKEFLKNIVVVLAIGLAGMAIGVSAVNAQDAGEEGGPCRIDPTAPDCNSPLVCENDICVQPTTAGDACTNNAACSDPNKSCMYDGKLGYKRCCDTSWGCVSAAEVKDLTGLGNQDPREIAANVINVILGFLGIIAVILILAGGFMWMTAAGNDEKIETAKKIMSAGVVGLIIVLAAFGIAQFVVNALVGATT